jgi:hypothetical protein
MLVRAMPAPATFSRRALSTGLLLAAGVLASCSSNDSTPVQPGPDPNPAPTPLYVVVGEPAVGVRINALLNELSDGAHVAGSFSAILTDSSGHTTFLPDARLNGVPLHEEFDPQGPPLRYTLDPGDVPGLGLDDTLRFEAIDGGSITQPFAFLMSPPSLTLPPDSTVFAGTEDITLEWKGAVERVILTLTDITGKRLSINLRVENYSGLHEVVVPGRDLAALNPGTLFVGADVLNTEIRIVNGSRIQNVSLETRQSRIWKLAP